MFSSDLVSIIIPVFNTGKYLIRCIESCINQTYTNLEIILVDDCSTDPYTIELMQDYASKDSRIRILRSPQNSGQAFCRNMGIDACKGKYFTMIDSDDSFAVTFIEKTHDAIVESEVDFVLTNICQYVDDNSRVGDSLGETDFNLNFACYAISDFDSLIKKGQLLTFPVYAFGKLFDSEKYRSAGLFFDPNPMLRSVEDMSWKLDLQFKLKNFYYLPIFGVFRLKHENSESTVSLEYSKRILFSLYTQYNILEKVSRRWAI